ncbi:MAG: HAMP domain-containing sensor histidine kinase [Lachnospiraceae bacterium]|nr:HAMP domain-containing sensor histidine kinase [Lachnospiraceae bacterium]
MDIRWKSISRQVLLWIAIAAILISTYFGFFSIANLLNVARCQEESNAFFSVSPADYFTDQTFEESYTYENYLRDIVQRLINQYKETGTWKLREEDGYTKAELEELDVNFFGEIICKKGYDNKTMKLGSKIDTEKKSRDNLIYVRVYPDKIDSEYGQIRMMFYSEKGGDLYSSCTEEYYDDGEVKQHKDFYNNIESFDFYMEIPQKNYERLENAWLDWMDLLKSFVNQMMICIGVVLVSIIMIIVTASPKFNRRWEDKFDRMWLEILLLIVIPCLLTLAGLCVAGYYSVWEQRLAQSIGNLAMAGGLIFEFLTIYCFVSIVRKIKAGYFIKSSICYKVLHKSWIVLKDQKNEWTIWSSKKSSTLTVKEKALKRKRFSLLMILAAEVIFLFLIIAIFGFLPLGILAAALLAVLFKRLFDDYKQDVQDLLDLEKVLQQIYEISNGDLKATTDIGENSLYYKATTSLCEIGSGMEKSVEEQVKSQKMKVDLIQNVSHDLKTPLTSIISYIDLLSKDESLSDEAKDYVMILEKKSQRLKNIVTDLFDLAKTTSGNVTADFSILDMRKLVEQTLVEMDDKISSSGFEVITHYDTETAQFQGDVNRMYRVVQNVLDNALQYSLSGSRIYLSVLDDGEKWKLSVKNTASYHMQFTEEEILERFTRGDQSRTTEGSGLGLSIADSFTRLCGGDFHIKIDGDQFTVEITFVKY